MWLRSLEIKNFLSLDHVKIDNISQINVLIGKNNSGKSAVFSALEYLSCVVTGRNIPKDLPKAEFVLTDQDPQRAFSIKLILEMREEDRREYVSAFLPPDRAADSEAILETAFARIIECSFVSSKANPVLLHLRETRILSADGKLAAIQSLIDSPQVDAIANPEHRLLDLAQIYDGTMTSIDFNSLGSVEKPAHHHRFNNRNLFKIITTDKPYFSWVQNRLARFLSESFFFNPFRHCNRQMQAHETDRLDQNGNNLAQVLDTVLGRDRQELEKIQAFMDGAVGGLGRLQTPPRASNREVGFRSTNGNYFIHLHDMGGGLNGSPPKGKWLARYNSGRGRPTINHHGRTIP